MHNQRLSLGVEKSWIAAVALAAASFGACASDAPDAAADEAPTAEVLEQRSGGGSLRDPRGGFIADVIANGTGCPAGTWETSLSSDGQVFTTTFSAYEAEVDRRSSVSVKDCTLTLKLRSPAGRSYSLQSFYYQGYAFLERGVSGRQSAQYYFQGDPASGSSAETNLRGPYDSSYLFNDDVAVKNAWSPCGLERNLNVITRIRLTNDNSGRAGYMNMSAVDGRNQTKLVFRLASRSCRGDDRGNDNNNDDDWRNDDNNNDDDWRNDDNNNDDDWRNDDNNNNDDDWRNDDNRGPRPGGFPGGGFPGVGGPVIIDVDRDRL